MFKKKVNAYNIGVIATSYILFW